MPRRQLFGRVCVVAAIGALIALPWWLRNLSVFRTPAPGQLADNALLTTNYQIFNFADRPSLEGFVSQGPATIAAHVAQGLWHDAVDVLLVPGNIVTVLALLTIALGWRRWRAIDGSPLLALLAYGGIAFVMTSVVFPVATQWGTFEHAAGPLMVAFVILAILGGDALVARIRAWRNWPRPNAGMAPAALGAIVLTMAALQLTFAANQAAARERQISAVAETLRATGVADGAPIVTDRPLWLSDALGTPALVLPQDGVPSVAAVAHMFGAHYVVLVDGQTTGPDIAAAIEASSCMAPLPIEPPAAAVNLEIYHVAQVCP